MHAVRGKSRPVERLSPEDQLRIQQLFAGRRASWRLFVLVREYICSLGGVATIPRKTQVGFSHGRMFAWVWLPQLWIRKAPRESIVLTFGLDHRVRDPRIMESLEPYPGRFTHHVVIQQTSGFDPKVRGWVREAYELAAKPHRRLGR